MRILSVRFENLNSLVGNWQLDFTGPDYISDGIFAITGPTGAGKSTILDAIALALYGQTPRLGKLTKSSNDIMSRHTGSCFSEVEFETDAGRFLAHFRQHRARKKQSGALQAPQHELSKFITPDQIQILESHRARVADAIEQVTGMDFDRFTRSMLLAQGDFAAFLTSNSDERSDILEQITGTQLYSEISKAVHVRRNEEQQKLSILTAALTGIMILTPEELDAEKTALTTSQGERAKRQQVVSVLEKALGWIDALEKAKQNVAECQEQWDAFLEREQAFSTHAARLELDQKARVLIPEHTTVSERRQQQKDRQEQLQKSLKKQEATKEARENKTTVSEKATASAKEQERMFANESALVEKVVKLDLLIEERRQTLETAEETYKRREKEKKKTLARVHNAQSAMADIQEAMDQTERYEKEHGEDAALVEGIGVIRKDLQGLEALFEQHRKVAKECTDAKAAETKSTEKRKAKHEALLLAKEKRNEAHARHEEILIAHKEALQGKDLASWHEAQNSARETLDALTQVTDQSRRLSSEKEALHAALEKQVDLSKTLDEIARLLADTENTKDAAEKEITRLETEVHLRMRIRDLEQDRAHLVDGEPCPLCGATEHPLASKEIPKLDEAEKALAKAKKDEKRAKKAATKLMVQQGEMVRDIQNLNERILEHKKTVADLEPSLIEMVTSLGIAPVDDTLVKRADKAKKEAKVAWDHTKKTIAQITTLEKREKKLLEAVTSTKEAAVKAERLRDQETHREENAKNEWARIATSLESLSNQLEDHQALVFESLTPFRIATIAENEIQEIIAHLKKRRDSWSANKETKTSLQKQQNEQEKIQEAGQVLLEKNKTDLQDALESRNDLKGACTTLSDERTALYGNKNPTEELGRLKESLEKRLEDKERAQTELHQTQAALTALEESITDLKVEIDIQHEALLDLEDAFNKNVTAAGFADEAGFIAASLSQEERANLLQRQDALREERTTLATRVADAKTHLKSETDKQVTSQDRESLQQELETEQSSLEQHQQQVTLIQDKLNRNEKNKRAQKTQLEAKNRQHAEWVKWENLHALIGSADGKKYRNFAQGLTFDVMVKHANKHLRKMCDRYLLVRDIEEPLMLNVIDSYQAGEIRSTRNLSGGESFLVSLSLALGLSSMASRNVRIDSLFLDEGFGTLDEDALETALDTLAGLHRDGGKLIGVISHVGALKERIAAQIEVVPKSGGKSRIVGPGCMESKEGGVNTGSAN